jgi:hypothetical protein
MMAYIAHHTSKEEGMLGSVAGKMIVDCKTLDQFVERENAGFLVQIARQNSS